MKNIDSTVNVLKALGDPTRFKILMHLISSGNNLCVTALSGKLEVAQPVVSQHLKILKNAGLVNSNRIGYHIHYAANKDKIIGIADKLNELAEISHDGRTNNSCRKKINSSEE